MLKVFPFISYRPFEDPIGGIIVVFYSEVVCMQTILLVSVYVLQSTALALEGRCMPGVYFLDLKFLSSKSNFHVSSQI